MTKSFSYSEKISLSILILIVITLVSFFFCNPVLGANPRDALTSTAKTAGIKTTNSLGYILGQFFQKILGVMGLILLILFVIGGITWMTSEGNAEKLKKAHGLLINGIIGLFIVLASYALIEFVTRELQSVVK